MKRFDRFFHLFERASDLVPADRCYIGNLELLEEKGRIGFVNDLAREGVRRFFSAFRWVFLALSIGISVYVYQSVLPGSHGVVVIFAWIFILGALGMGAVGAFVIVPVLSRVFRRIESLGDRDRSRLPSFDLINRTVNPPDSKPGYPFDCVAGLKSEEAAEGWQKLVLVTTDNSGVFLVNYPASETKMMSKTLARISEMTSIKILE